MENEFFYMLGIVAVGFAVNFGLRSVPFVLFGGRNREVPSWIRRSSAYVSPVIIAGLIVYGYSGSAWRTPWPYVAGAVTVAFQFWRRNPLASIVAGTALYMLLLNCCGCSTSQTLELDAQHPAVRVSTQGVLFGDRYVRPQEVAGILKDYDVPRDRVIHILLDPDVRDLGPARTLMGYLSRAGYTRPVLVTKRHAEAENLGKKKGRGAVAAPVRAPAKKAIRYKGANE